MNFEIPEEGLERNLFFLGVTLVLAAGVVAANNLASGSGTDVGPVEVSYECHGLDLGVCLGIERPHHEVTAYDEFEELPEEGTDEYYDRVESELMIQAYNICEDKSLEGMEWLDQAEFENRSGEEWFEMEEVELLGCEETFRFEVDE